MTDQQRKLVSIFVERLGSDAFITDITTTEIKQIAKPFFVRKTIDPSSENALFNDTHERTALKFVCQALLGPDTVHVVPEFANNEDARVAWKFVAAMVLKGDESVAATVNEALTWFIFDLYYATSRPTLFDMFVHLSASEIFFIDGDSLLLAAFAQYRVDWDLVQPLHVSYLVQKLLSDMRQRDAVFHVVFFDSMLWMWEKSPKKLFIRECVREALMNVSTEYDKLSSVSVLPIHSFTSFTSPEFGAHIRKYEPEFILMWDGEQMTGLSALQQMYTHESVAYRSIVDDEEVGKKASVYYHCFLAWAILHRIKVAFASRVIYKENALLVFAVNNSSDRFSKLLEIEKDLLGLISSLEHTVSFPELSDDAKAAAEDSDVTLREQIVSGAVFAFLNATDAATEALRTPQNVALCKAMMVTTYVTGFLNSELRSQSAAKNDEISNFLSVLAPYLTSTLHHRGCADGRGTEFDLIDGHLLAAVVRELSASSVADLLDEDGANDVNYAWQTVSNSAELITESPIANLPVVESTSPVSVEPYKPFKHELVSKLVKAFEFEDVDGASAFPDTYGKADLLMGWDIVTPLDYYNDVIDVKSEEEKKKSIRTDARAQKKELKRRTDFTKDMTAAAQSLGIKAFVNTNEFITVASDSDNDTPGETAKEKDDGKKAPHAGQKNKKARSKEEIIREERNIRDATRAVRDLQKAKELLLQKTDVQPPRATQVDRESAIRMIRSALPMLPELAKNFDLNQSLGKTADGVPLKLAMWRLLVNEAGERESDVALGITTATSPKNSKKKDDSLPMFNTIDALVQSEVPSGTTQSATSWGKLEDLRLTERITNNYEVASYLRWVYLSFVELHIRFKYHTRILKLQLDSWKDERERARLAKEAPNLGNGGSELFLGSHLDALSLIRDNGFTPSSDDVDIVRSALAHFDFAQDYLDKVDRTIGEWQSKAVPILSQGMKPRQKLLNITPERMQLDYMGHLLERPVLPDRDYRVLFNPDQWQRDLLDVVDRRGCAVVCAPTSAGKTFISYYCMYSTLKKSNKRIVLYIAPTRALINQAVADVCARYGSKKYRSPGRNVYGVLAGLDYHMYHDDCQILITLPEQLETLLMSPKYTEMVQRFDYAVLDEIHTMESSGNGDVWERVLALLPCPFIALSATLGETKQLGAWLGRCLDKHAKQSATPTERDFNVYSIPLEGKIERWNDIQKYIYQPDPGVEVPLKKLNSKYEKSYIQNLHPLSIVTLDQLRRGFPPDLSLVPSESVSLYEKLLSVFKTSIWMNWSTVPAVKEMKSSLEFMRPETFFAAENYITQTRARQYEQQVKNELLIWVYLTTATAQDESLKGLQDVAAFNASMTEAVESVLRSFSKSLYEVEKSLDSHALTNRGSPFPDSSNFIKANIINVIRELFSRDMGPTIVFSFETESCYDLVNYVVTQLEHAEQAYRATDEFARYQQAMNLKAEAKAKLKKQRESTLKQKKLVKDDDGGVEENERELSDADEGDDNEFSIPDVLPEFTFIGQETRIEADQLQSFFDDFDNTGMDLYKRAVQRGIGIHHAGVPGKVRRRMERLFCGRYCSVIFSTETLALGIHSPCRSVVLAGDHVLLNTTQFRQMMGRAGRRGLDFIGHLVFLGVTMKKITRLMTSGMTIIKGNVQMDPLQCLRVLQLHDFNDHRENDARSRNLSTTKQENKAAWKRQVANAAERLFANPLFFQGRAAMLDNNMERFTIRYFQMLLTFFHDEGLQFKEVTSSLGSLLVNLLHIFHNPAATSDGFAIISMLTGGAFDKARYSKAVEWITALNQTSNDVTEDGEDRGVLDEAAMEALAYAVSVHPLHKVAYEIHRSALADPTVTSAWDGNAQMVKKRHRVVLTALSHLNLHSSTSATDNAPFFKLLSSFYHSEAQQLETPAKELLPFMAPKTKKKNPIFGKLVEDFAIVGQLRKTASPFSARSPFVAISGCGDAFDSIDDVVSTLRDGLFCDRRMLPIADFTDGGRHDRSPVLLNACLADFIRVNAQIDSTRKNYRNTLLEQLNGVRISDSYAFLHRTLLLLGNLKDALAVQNTTVPQDDDGEVQNDGTKNGTVSLMPTVSESEGAFYAGVQRMMPVAQRLASLDKQIDQKYNEILLMEQQKKTREDFTQKRAAAQKAFKGL